jgi:signal transduction histidine kinase
MMEGDLTVRSEPGQGSVFTLWLPVPAAEAPEPTEAPLQHR